MKYSLMSLMVEPALRKEKLNFILRSMLANAGISETPTDAEEAFRLLRAHGIQAVNGTASFEDMVRFTKEAGFDGLDLMAFQMEQEGKALRSVLERHGVTLSSVNLLIPFSEAADETAFQDRLNEAKHGIDEAVDAGAKRILLVPGSYGLGEGMTREQAFQTMVRGLKACVAHAGDRVIVSTETLESISVPLASLGEMRRVFQAVPELRYTHDAGNPLVANEDPLALYRAFEDRVVSVHFKDLGYAPEGPYRCMDGRRLELAASGRGLVDFRALIRFLLQRNYQGYIALEGRLGSEDPWQAAVNALQYFRTMEAEIQSELR